MHTATGRTRVLATIGIVAAICGVMSPAAARAKELDPSEVESIAEDAFVYGFPMVMNYAVFFEYFVDRKGKEYKTPIGQLYNTARVYTPADTAIVTPNSDTPYSFVAMDLRAEPFVICNPEIEKFRYFSIQLVDMYTFNYGYMGSRTTGNGAACHLVAGPRWKGEKPKGIDHVFQSETDFSFAIIRTQLFRPSDLENVKRVQAGYRALPLSRFSKQPAPPRAPRIEWPRIDKQSADADPFAYLNFVLQLCPAIGPAAVEAPMRARFATIGVEAGKPFPSGPLSPARKEALARGMKRGLARIKEELSRIGRDENGWHVATEGFGDRQQLGGNYTVRAAAAMAGIYGNTAAEALYPLLAADSEGQKLDTATARYTLTFPKDGLPPVNAFWSVTMYDGRTQLLIENPIDRYLINSPMLPALKKNPDGSLTVYIQKDSPGAARQSNWLPAPDGPPYVVMRLYWPKESALKGTWKPPAVLRAR